MKMSPQSYTKYFTSTFWVFTDMRDLVPSPMPMSNSSGAAEPILPRYLSEHPGGFSAAGVDKGLHVFPSELTYSKFVHS